jgi:hypothetical protein
MERMLPVEFTVFFQLNLICLLFFVPGGGVIPALAFRTLQNNDLSHLTPRFLVLLYLNLFILAFFVLNQELP